MRMSQGRDRSSGCAERLLCGPGRSVIGPGSAGGHLDRLGHGEHRLSFTESLLDPCTVAAMEHTKSWYVEQTEAPQGWGSSDTSGQGALRDAARAARTIGKTGRNGLDRAVAVASVIFILIASFGLVFVALLSYVCWRHAVRRSRQLDLRPWLAATPTHGAQRFVTRAVPVPAGASPEFRRTRWWQVTDDTGEFSLGLVGVRRRTKETFIIPAADSDERSAVPMNVPNFWKANSTIYASCAEKGLRILQLDRASGEPVVAVRFEDPGRREGVEALVYSMEALGEAEIAILSCVALFVAKVTPRRVSKAALDASEASPGNSAGNESTAFGSASLDDAWPAALCSPEKGDLARAR